jgi:hypothetical protein
MEQDLQMKQQSIFHLQQELQQHEAQIGEKERQMAEETKAKLGVDWLDVFCLLFCFTFPFGLYFVVCFFFPFYVFIVCLVVSVVVVVVVVVVAAAAAAVVVIAVVVVFSLSISHLLALLKAQEEELYRQQRTAALEAAEAERLKHTLLARQTQIETEKAKMADIKQKLTAPDQRYFIEKPKNANYAGAILLPFIFVCLFFCVFLSKLVNCVFTFLLYLTRRLA